MAPEAVMLLIDSSEYMRNGDFPPTRFEAQSDAVSVLFNAKINSNPENTVGVMTMGGFNGKGPEVLATPTADLGKILSAMHKASIGGESDLYTGIQIAQLALKHRQNKTQRQRLIILVGSPLSRLQDEKSLIKLGKKLKKNNVAVDVVTFASEESEAVTSDGEAGTNESVLAKLVESVSSGDNSHFLSVKPGPRLLSDMIISSDILAADGMGGFGGGGGMDVEGGAGGGGGGGGDFEFGVDPDMDPELAMVLRMSMEEERARQAAAAEPSAAPSLPPVPESAPSSEAVPAPALAPFPSVPASSASAAGEDDPELAAALALSSAAPPAGDVEMDAREGEDDEDEDEDEAIRRAIELSMQEEQEKKDGNGA